MDSCSQHLRLVPTNEQFSYVYGGIFTQIDEITWWRQTKNRRGQELKLIVTKATFTIGNEPIRKG